jgi:hypothetical protein
MSYLLTTHVKQQNNKENYFFVDKIDVDCFLVIHAHHSKLHKILKRCRSSKAQLKLAVKSSKARKIQTPTHASAVRTKSVFAQ